MAGTYGVYYDFGRHVQEKPNWETNYAFIDFVKHYLGVTFDGGAIAFLNKQNVCNYRGIVGDEDIYIENFEGKPKIFDVRLSAIEDKNAKPICYMVYNQNGYSNHCKSYKEYQEWVANRNPIRFRENQQNEFDRKNVAHCVRLLHMGIEIATTGEVHVNRSNIDRDFLLSIRNGETTYDEIMAYVNDKLVELECAIKLTTLPEHVDPQMANDLLINIRHQSFHELNA